jgi:hypothetical protein
VYGVSLGHQPASGSIASTDSPPAGAGTCCPRVGKETAVVLERRQLGDAARVALLPENGWR